VPATVFAPRFFLTRSATVDLVVVRVLVGVFFSVAVADPAVENVCAAD
jgi:hypothetical protein